MSSNWSSRSPSQSTSMPCGKRGSFSRERHAAFRTAFTSDGDGTACVIDEVEIQFIELDWSEKFSRDRDTPAPNSKNPSLQCQAYDEWLRQDRRRGFDFSTPPLSRIALFRFGPIDHRLVWTFHHALLDGRSHRLVLEEAFAAYDAFKDGTYPSLLPVRPFADHVEWLSRQDRAAAECFWRSVLADFAPTPVPA